MPWTGLSLTSTTTSFLDRSSTFGKELSSHVRPAIDPIVAERAERQLCRRRRSCAVCVSARSVSKQQAIMPGQCYELEDGSSSFKDFHGSRNNRFTSAEQAAKNRIQHPSNVLHFFNGQPDISAEMFNQVSRTWQLCSVLFWELFTCARCNVRINPRLHQTPLSCRSAKNWKSRSPPM